jgi:hypothetical protein
MLSTYTKIHACSTHTCFKSGLWFTVMLACTKNMKNQGRWCCSILFGVQVCAWRFSCASFHILVSRMVACVKNVFHLKKSFHIIWCVNNHLFHESTHAFLYLIRYIYFKNCISHAGITWLSIVMATSEPQ